MSHNFYQAAIVVHIVGITFLTGATVIDLFGFRMFWQSLTSNRSKALAIFEMTSLCQRLMGVGMGVIILSGIAMMFYMHGVWGEQTWFRVKFGLLLLVIINGLGIRRLLGSRLKKCLALSTSQEDAIPGSSPIKRNLQLVHSIQFILLISIFVLSVFKFN